MSGATGYRVDVSTNPSFNSYVTGYQNLNVGNATGRSVTGLNASTTYYYRVRACNGHGTSGNSNVVHVTTLSPTGLPVAITNPATSIASFPPKLNGRVNPHGLSTTVYFQYGRTTSYGNRTPNQTKTGNNSQNVSANISGLSANTTYHFRIVATNGIGTGYGTDRTFTTQYGFVLGTARRVIVRAIGPELGVPNALADPTLELHNGTGALNYNSNDNWQHTIIGGIITANQVTEIRNSGHAPTVASKSAIIADLPPGHYAAIVRGVNNTNGVLFEWKLLPAIILPFESQLRGANCLAVIVEVEIMPPIKQGGVNGVNPSSIYRSRRTSGFAHPVKELDCPRPVFLFIASATVLA